MRTFPRNASGEEIKEVVRHWIDLLGRGETETAVAMLAKEDTTGLFESDDPDLAESPRTWTDEDIRAVIGNYGIEGPLAGVEGKIYKVSPVTDSIRDQFETYLRVDFFYDEDDEFNDPDDAELDPTVADVHVGLPLLGETGEYVSDLTARLDVFKLDDNQLVLALRDIHVL